MSDLANCFSSKANLPTPNNPGKAKVTGKLSMEVVKLYNHGVGVVQV